ncbi:MAG: DUF3017 domain-containing protein [Nocardioidaceae bacterium]
MSGLDRPQLGTGVYLLVLAALVVALVLVSLGSWRLGLGVAGASVIVACVARGVIPERMAGLLRIRRRASDMVMMAVIGVGLVVLAFIVPTRP